MSLWGSDFEIQEKKQDAKKLIQKISKPKKVVINDPVKKTTSSRSKVSVDPYSLIPYIQKEVYRILGKYKDNTIVIRTYEELKNYIDVSIQNGVIAIDTETNNSLDPISCKLMGACIYTPHMKQAYIPVNHVDRQGKLLVNQLTESQIKEQFDRLINTKIIMHHGKFDYQVIKCTCNCILSIYWDTMIAVKILDETEKRAALKEQYVDKIDSTQEKYDIEHLFEGVPYAILDPELFALYAASDSRMTYQLYEWQLNQFNQPGNEKLFSVFMNVEMPVVQVAAEMELRGITIDTEYAERLSKKYHSKVDEVDKKIAEELEKYSAMIKEWRKTPEANFHPKKDEYSEKLLKSKNEQLKDPISITSTTQLAILLYDILKIDVIDSKQPRGTGEDILQKIDLPICKLILEKRGLEKLLGTYIDKLPKCINSVDGRLHAKFNQIGTDTGRFSSSDPNLQNIPSHDKSIRLMFKARPGYMLVGADYSQQEPRLLCEYSHDETMTNAYMNGKDLYATIASGIYNNDYWDNMEHYEDGTPNPEGKKRRSNCKSILLGIMYGRGAASIADQIGSSVQDAQKIVDDFYRGFPKVKEWVNKTEEDAKVNGYVEDLWGRRRRLPDIKLPKYTIKYDKESTVFNPILYSQGKYTSEGQKLIVKYNKQLETVKSRKDYQMIKSEAAKENISITDNGGFISRAERQCVNSRVQGGAATMSKIAMRKVFDNQELKDLDFHILLQVHDELIGECPIENVDVVAHKLTQVMKESAKPVVQIPFKCDATIEQSWYYTDYSDALSNEYQKLLKTENENDAFEAIFKEHQELTEEQLRTILNK